MSLICRSLKKFVRTRSCARIVNYFLTIDQWMSSVDWWNDNDRGKRGILIKSCASNTFFATWIPHVLDWDRTRPSVVRNRRLTSWVFLISAGTPVILSLFQCPHLRINAGKIYLFDHNRSFPALFAFIYQPTDERYLAWRKRNRKIFIYRFISENRTAGCYFLVSKL
jgi:hypothetical protein